MKSKVLIVDDSALMRKFHKQLLEKVGFITEIARNGEECLAVLNGFAPDVIVLDINMPVMDGLTCLKEIMRVRPTPVVMVSSITEKGAQETFEALSLGAVDYIQKPSGRYSYNMGTASAQMAEKILSAASIKLSSSIVRKNKQKLSEESRQTPVRKSPPIALETKKHDLIVVGVSTGGPNCLQTILSTLPVNFSTPIIIAQHMPKRFTKVFAERLNSMCQLTVVEVTQKQKVQQGYIYIAQGDGDIVIEKQNIELYVSPVASDKSYLWHPSVSKLVDTALLSVPPNKLCCIQLTGMGNDGVQEMLKAFNKGATTIAESSDTAVVFGMPGELVKKNGATHVAPNHKIASLLI
jgi:two-component system chemotaxis response regulator CheB